ncbi:MAG TPA: ferritin-like domain-containing protein, partial [Bradyrhizobium sp.]|nr:ferritin-like domain-containing protein [Bradyrhizobium sp.]
PLKDMTPDQRAVMQPIVDSRPTQSAVHPVGVLYAKLYWLFQADDSATQPWPEIAALGFDPDRHVADFPGEASSTTFQVDPEAEPYWKSGDGRGGIFKKISSRAAALQALFAIASQGEGLAGANDQQSHFAKFLDIFSNTDFSQLPAKWPTDPFLSDQVDADPTREANRIGNPTAAALCRVFDLRYQILLTSIRAALSRNRTSPAEVAVRMKYVGWAFEEMVSSIKHLAKFIAKLPRKAALGAGQPVAAPTFALDNLSIPDTAAELDRKLADLHRLAAAAIDDALGKGVEAGARLVLSGMRTNDKLRFPELPDVIA